MLSVLYQSILLCVVSATDWILLVWIIIANFHRPLNQIEMSCDENGFADPDDDVNH